MGNTTILQKQYKQDVQGIAVFTRVRQLNGKLLHGYQVGDSIAFIQHWKSVIKSACRQAEEARIERLRRSI